MEFIFFDQDDRILFRRSDAISAHVVHEELKHTATFPDDPQKLIRRGMRVGWLDRNKDLLLFEIRLPTRTLPDHTVSYTAEHICISELMDEVVQDKRSYNVSAYSALENVLEDTPWRVGRVDVNPTGSGNFYWISAWESALKVRDAWGVRIRPRLAFDGTQITGRYLDILSTEGTFRGVRLQVDQNIEQAGVTYDDRSLVTALYGRGKGENLGGQENGEEKYGRRITFDEVVWSKANGDPADKPAGQLYVEDVHATALYGRKGHPRFGVVEFDDCEDKKELLSLTWDELERRSVPSVTISMTLLNLRDIGYADQGLDLGDLVNVIIKPFDLRMQARVVQLDEDLIHPENTQPVIGDYMSDIVGKMLHTKKAASIGQKLAQAAPSLLQGYIDTAVTGIMSSKTKRETLPDGSEIYMTEDGGKAVRFTGAGILLADNKDAAGNWSWRTAITGSGMVADEITTGTLNANLLKFLGSGTYMDGTTLRIQHPSVGANVSTELGLDGFKMISKGRIMGGLYKLGTDILSAVQTLYNPSEPLFQANVGRTAVIGMFGLGIELLFNGISGGFVGPYTQDGASPSGLAIMGRTVDIEGESSVIIRSNGNGGIAIDAGTEDVTFDFTYAGVRRSVTIGQLWNEMPKG